MIAKRIMLYASFGCLTYLVALIVMLPAPWVSHVIERFSKQLLVLRDPTGTAWAGSGHLYARERSGDLLDLGALRWNTSLSAILAGNLGADLVLGDGAQTMQLNLSPASTTIRGLKLELPGRIIASVASGLETLGPRGRLLIRSDNLRLDANSVLGLAEIEWRPVQLSRAHGLDLGSHIARLRGGGSKIDIELGTVEGPARLSGSGTWTQGTGLNISGTLEHGEDRSATMAPFLQGVCSEYRPGRCSFRFKQ